MQPGLKTTDLIHLCSFFQLEPSLNLNSSNVFIVSHPLPFCPHSLWRESGGRVSSEFLEFSDFKTTFDLNGFIEKCLT